MEFIVQPIGHVRAARQTPEDDNWGGAEATIELVDHLADAALAGLDAFSMRRSSLSLIRSIPGRLFLVRAGHATIRRGRSWASSPSVRRTGPTDWA